MTTVIRAAGAAEFLALIPRLTGYLPSRSLLLLPFCGSRTAGALRLDLPDTTDSDEIDRIASTFIGFACKVAHTDGVAIAVYTDHPLRAGEAMTSDALVRALIRRAELCGLRVRDALCVSPGGWGSYLDPDLPWSGRALREIPYDDDVADWALRSGGQAGGAELPSPDPAEMAQVARLLAVAGPPPRESWGVDDPLDDVPLLFEEALSWPTASLLPEQSALLVFCLARPALRDIALLLWAADRAKGEAALDAQMAWAEGAPYPPQLAQTMWGAGETPDAGRLETALELCRNVAAIAPRPQRPGPLSACAWLAWALGRSTHAGLYATAARDIDPHHGLAEIVLAMVSHAHLPEWAFDRPAPHALPATRRIDSSRDGSPAARGRSAGGARRAT